MTAQVQKRNEGLSVESVVKMRGFEGRGGGRGSGKSRKDEMREQNINQF